MNTQILPSFSWFFFYPRHRILDHRINIFSSHRTTFDRLYPGCFHREPSIIVRLRTCLFHCDIDIDYTAIIIHDA